MFYAMHQNPKLLGYGSFALPVRSLPPRLNPLIESDRLKLVLSEVMTALESLMPPA